MLQTLEEQARRYATKAHADAGQRRKYTDEPYIVHPAAVVDWCVASVTTKRCWPPHGCTTPLKTRRTP